MKPVITSFAFAAVALARVAAQQPQAPPAAQPPVFRADTDLVQVDVVVRDKSGRFVGDLALSDFEIREQNEVQPIQQLYLRIVSGNAWPIDSTRTAGQPLAVPAPPGAAQRIFVAFFDDAHMTAGGFKRTQAAAADLFAQHFRTGDVGGVVVGGQMVNKRLTTDREELLKAVRNAKPNLAKNSRIFDEQQWPRVTEAEALLIAGKEDRAVLSAAVTRACAEDEGACTSRLDVPGLIREKASMLVARLHASTNATMQGLTAVLNGLARIEGRKTILLLSEGFQADGSWPFIEQATGLATLANARVYTLDARGLDRGMAERLRSEVTSGDDPLLNLLNGSDSEADSINSLAADTGGFVVRNTNIFDKAIARIVDDASNYYVLGYRPTSKQDGTFHKISVTVNRPGISVRARRGYVAMPPPMTSTTADAAGSASARPELVEGRAQRDPQPAERLEARASEPAASAASSTAVIVPRDEAPSSAVRLRPDAATHVEALGKDLASDGDATSGWAAYQRGDLETARTELSKAAAHGSAHPWVFYALGQSQYALTQYREAAGSWEHVRSTTPEFKPVYFDLVDAYLQLKEYDKAVRLMRDADRRWKHDSETLNALGVVQVARGSLDDAVQSFTQATAAAPAEGTGYFNLAKAIELRYWKNRRFVHQTQQWMANGNDRTAAIANYKRYLEIGGSLETAARNGLARLEWASEK